MTNSDYEKSILDTIVSSRRRKIVTAISLALIASLLLLGFSTLMANQVPELTSTSDIMDNTQELPETQTFTEMDLASEQIGVIADTFEIYLDSDKLYQINLQPFDTDENTFHQNYSKGKIIPADRYCDDNDEEVCSEVSDTDWINWLVFDHGTMDPWIQAFDFNQTQLDDVYSAFVTDFEDAEEVQEEEYAPISSNSSEIIHGINMEFFFNDGTGFYFLIKITNIGEGYAMFPFEWEPPAYDYSDRLQKNYPDPMIERYFEVDNQFQSFIRTYTELLHANI